jgi:hypothetical protein
MTEEKLTIYTVNYPLTYFAERIGGDLVSVVFPAPPDVDPAFWVPDTAKVRSFLLVLPDLNGVIFSLSWNRMLQTWSLFSNELPRRKQRGSRLKKS